jgi:hypothetical protein
MAWVNSEIKESPLKQGIPSSFYDKISSTIEKRKRPV